MALGKGNNNSANGKDSGSSNDYEVLLPISKKFLLGVQFIQTIALLMVAWLWKNGSDNWLGNLMPGGGTFVAACLITMVFVILWVQRIKVLDTAR